eukprot:CAMPEP_0171073158 /NCGR_PEP_ID=MMETSP0766_2-20121228/11329_1 /TAXON_ID=439317 /ORGANISM="Gambierdiscus australes, Strain CAWD 149" /LENGTH=107 /DNA_ID=CAMNT_0011529821 /DNA_START=14 /DNA_END=334 /DNA_ORIENTATION=-
MGFNSGAATGAAAGSKKQPRKLPADETGQGKPQGTCPARVQQRRHEPVHEVLEAVGNKVPEWHVGGADLLPGRRAEVLAAAKGHAPPLHELDSAVVDPAQHLVGHAS